MLICKAEPLHWNENLSVTGLIVGKLFSGSVYCSHGNDPPGNEENLPYENDGSSKV